MQKPKIWISLNLANLFAIGATVLLALALLAVLTFLSGCEALVRSSTTVDSNTSTANGGGSTTANSGSSSAPTGQNSTGEKSDTDSSNSANNSNNADTGTPGGSSADTSSSVTPTEKPGPGNLTAMGPPSFPFDIVSFTYTYTITGYETAKATNGTTLIIIDGTGFDQLPIVNGTHRSPLWCSFTSGNTEHDSTRCTTSDTTLTFSFDSSAAPDWITMTSGDTDELITSFYVAATPQFLDSPSTP